MSLSVTNGPEAVTGGVEREIKIGGVDLFSVERSLVAASAVQGRKPYWERNWVLDRQGELRAQGRLLRVREHRARDGSLLGAVLTVKAPVGPTQQQAAERRGVKERIERETSIGDACTTLEALALLGYRCTSRYEKVRSVWTFQDHEVMLDQTPIGEFVEVEGPDPRPVAEALALPLEAVDERGYLAIYADYRATHGGASKHMVFKHGAPPGFVGEDTGG